MLVSSMLADLIRLRGPLIQRIELAAPWGIRVAGCPKPGMYAIHRGSARFDATDLAIELGTGDLVLLPSGGPHRVTDRVGTPARAPEALAGRQCRRSDILCVSGPGEKTLLSAVPFADSTGLAWLPRVLVIRASDSDRVERALFDAYERALETGDPSVSSRVAEALWIRCIQARLPHLERFDPEVLRAANRVLERPELPHRVTDLARVAGLSRSRFVVRFQAAFKASPQHWIQTIRMQHARALLAEGLRVGQVAQQMGFADESGFRRAYRRVMGTGARQSRA